MRLFFISQNLPSESNLKRKWLASRLLTVILSFSAAIRSILFLSVLLLNREEMLYFPSWAAPPIGPPLMMPPVHAIKHEEVESFPSNIRIMVEIVSFPDSLPVFQVLRRLSRGLFIRIVEGDAVDFT